MLQDGEGAQHSETGYIPPGGEYTITASYTGRYYAQIRGPLSDVPIRIDGEEAGSYLSERYSGVIDLGWREAGERFTLSFESTKEIRVRHPRFYVATEKRQKRLDDYVAAVAAQDGAFTVEDGRITGQITAEEGQLLFTSIPYDAGWQAVVNGQVVQPQAFFEDYLAVPLSAGANTVQLRYRAPGAGASGWIISGLCLAVLAALQLLWRRSGGLPDAPEPLDEDEDEEMPAHLASDDVPEDDGQNEPPGEEAGR